MKTANLAIVFTDIKGFTERTSSQTLEQNQLLLQRHAQLLTPIFRAFGGRVVKSIGDAFLVTFESPTQSVLCGIALQDRLWLYNRTVPENERFVIRVAVNAGEVRLEDNDVFGEPVNIASRVEGITEAGWVYFTESVYLAMNKAEVPAEEVGQFELKGIPGKVRVYRVPRAPYRVEQTGGVEPIPHDSDAMPPYGNLGLSKVSDDPMLRALDASKDVAAKAAHLGGRAMALGGELVGKTGAALANAPLTRRIGRRNAVLGAAAAVLLLLVIVALSRQSGVSGAIRDVRNSSGRERDQLADVARRKIAQVSDEAERDYDEGQLEEALGRTGAAIRAYAAGAKAGSKPSEKRIVELLEHPTCDVRAAAAQAAGSLKLERARSKLQELAENGGTDEGVDIPLLGCNSKAAAARALRAMETAE